MNRKVFTRSKFLRQLKDVCNCEGPRHPTNAVVSVETVVDLTLEFTMLVLQRILPKDEEDSEGHDSVW